MKKFLFAIPLLAGILTVGCGSEKKKVDKYTDIEYEEALNTTKYITEQLQASVVEDKNFTKDYGIDFVSKFEQKALDKTDTQDGLYNEGTVEFLVGLEANGRFDLKNKDISVKINSELIEQVGGVLKGTNTHQTSKATGTMDEEFYILENTEPLGRYLLNSTKMEIANIINGEEAEKPTEMSTSSAMAYRGTATNSVETVTTSLEEISYKNMSLLPTSLESTHSNPEFSDKLVMQSIKTVDGYDGFVMTLEIGKKTKDGIVGEMYVYNEAKVIWDENYNIIEFTTNLENITEEFSFKNYLYFKVDSNVNEVKFPANKFVSGAPNLEEFTNPETVVPTIANSLII